MEILNLDEVKVIPFFTYDLSFRDLDLEIILHSKATNVFFPILF